MGFLLPVSPTYYLFILVYGKTVKNMSVLNSSKRCFKVVLFIKEAEAMAVEVMAAAEAVEEATAEVGFYINNMRPNISKMYC